MRNLLYCLLLLLASGCKKDLLHWQRAQRIETFTATDRLNAIYFIDDSTGFVVGGERFSRATILRTKDGGRTWAYQTFNEAGKSLFGITQAPSGKLYAVGFDGKMLISNDGGTNWEFRQLWYHPYKDIYFFNEDRGLVVGGVSFKNGFKTVIGQNGDQQPFDTTIYELNDIEMLDAGTGYLSGYGVVSKTNDSGRSWQELNIQNDNFTAVCALSEQEVWVCGYNGSVFHTKDGGYSWEKLRNGNDLTKPRYRLLDIEFLNGMEGYACGEDGLVIYTDDGGKHWMEFDQFTKSALRSIWPMRDGTLLVCGDEGSLYRLIKD